MGAPAHAVGSNQLQGAAYVFGSSGPLFKLSASPSSPSVLQGGQATSTITITPENSFNGSVSLSASGLPSGVTAVGNYLFNNCSSLTSATLATGRISSRR